MAIVDIYFVVVDSIVRFPLHVRGSSLLTALQASGVFLSVFTTTVRFVRCRQHSRKPKTAVANSHELVSCGNVGAMLQLGG